MGRDYEAYMVWGYVLDDMTYVKEKYADQFELDDHVVDGRNDSTLTVAYGIVLYSHHFPRFFTEDTYKANDKARVLAFGKWLKEKSTYTGSIGEPRLFACISAGTYVDEDDSDYTVIREIGDADDDTDDSYDSDD